MHPNALPSWLENTLIDSSYLGQKLKHSQHDIGELMSWLQSAYRREHLAELAEAQLEDLLIRPMLEKLGWAPLYQQAYTDQGKTHKPDWSLFYDAQQRDMGIKNGGTDNVVVLCESKRYSQALDTGKIDKKENPHFQLLDYLGSLRVDFGFLTNGRLWRFYDSRQRKRHKSYLQIDLELAFNRGEKDTALALHLLVEFFARSQYQVEQKTSPLKQTLDEAEHFTQEVEENLKAVIYGQEGEDSIFEDIGKAIYQQHPQQNMEAIYHNSLVLLFRLLFVAYFEDKNRQLLSSHPHYHKVSLENLHKQLTDSQPEKYNGYYELRHLFNLLDEGSPPLEIPLFNGGLFDKTRANLLDSDTLFNNRTLGLIINKLMYKTNDGEALLDIRRDYHSISITHLGHIYEGLLQFRFELATENSWYVELKTKAGSEFADGYYDAYDFAVMEKAARADKAKHSIKKYREISKGQLCLKSSINSRKTSASYYTPSSLSLPLVKTGIDHALALRGSVWDIKVLDNACGSGHFLVEALGYLTELAFDTLATDTALKQELEQEKNRISEELSKFSFSYIADESQILKRTLLKRCIYGVDLNPFAIELARLSLWIDSFIFGTPLSFIEHHIQVGNALIGSRIQDFEKISQQSANLFREDFSQQFNQLKPALDALAALKDTTSAD